MSGQGVEWGDLSIVIEFAGGPYRFKGLNSEQVTAVRERFVEFCAADLKYEFDEESKNCFIECSFYRYPATAFEEVDFNDRDYTFDRLYDEKDVRIAGKNFLTELTLQADIRAEIWLSEANEEFMFVFENMFRVLAAYRLMQLGGCIMHSACVARKDKAYMLLGHSGAGKSTFSKQALDAGWEVLSDDMNAVRLEGDQWLVEKLPFAGDLGQTPSRGLTYSLAGVYCIKQGHRNIIHMQSRSRTLGKALTCAPVLNDDNFRTTQLLDTLESMIEAVPTGLLEFTLEGGAADLLQQQNSTAEELREVRNGTV